MRQHRRQSSDTPCSDGAELPSSPFVPLSPNSVPSHHPLSQKIGDGDAAGVVKMNSEALGTLKINKLLTDLTVSLLIFFFIAATES
jgi:hypothetical protein